MKRVFSFFLYMCLSGTLLSGCDRLPDNFPSPVVKNQYTEAIPIDFSYVGYRKGEAELPSVRTIITLEAPADGSDATEMIQRAIDKVPAPGAVLLKAGEYRVGGKISINRNGVVLRGEGEATRIVATGTTQRTLMNMGVSTVRRLLAETAIVENALAGQMWVRVDDPSVFAVGDRVSVCLAPNDLWISDLKMDRIQGDSEQWEASYFLMYWDREVTRLEGDKVWLDCPLVMDLEARYAQKMALYKSDFDRIEESGIEDMFIVSEYDKTDIYDEDHAWTAISVSGAENCWIRGVKSAHFGYALVSLNKLARCITVKDCISTAPISLITGSRRYAFYIHQGQMCLFENCLADEDRHGFITGSRVPGPNVFLDCDMTNAHSVVGPHHRWATGLLYDCCQGGIRLEVNDRAHYGSGHGWPAVNCVFWNCTAEKVECQSPWISGKNWCVGTIGEKHQQVNYWDGLVRPDGEWMSPGVHVEPRSLYRQQLNKRLKNGK